VDAADLALFGAMLLLFVAILLLFRAILPLFRSQAVHVCCKNRMAVDQGIWSSWPQLLDS
jgi:hypothetical protein